MISKQEVKHIAKLAKLKVAKKEEEKLQKELSSVLDYAEKLKEIDVSQVEPCFHPIEIQNVTREDRKSQKSKVKSQKLLDLASNKKNKHIRVKAVL
ncbi:Asp-tRNA(Asn)/Glu-tRNA(Gln) amidotransferase subunit GatC [Candidatus Parcubacteria bacterium]|nr:Asp-tRNA(Asn)/Glu-tRNA(Gln) amidotransferase subunit GatC [Candidatus Parcubacteria bacterium]